MVHCIVHRENVKQEIANFGRDSDYRNGAAKADELIESLIQAGDGVLLIDRHRDTNKPDGFTPVDVKSLAPGTEVMMYGAYLGMCLSIVDMDLRRRKLVPVYHPEGCI